MRTLQLALCIGGLLGVSSSLAGPLQRADVAAEPMWLAHVDCDALRSTAIGKFILAEIDKPEAQAKFSTFESMTGINVRTQLHGLTLYCAGTKPEDGVLVVYADFDAEKLTNLAKAANDSASTKHNKYTIYNWVDDKRKAKGDEKARIYAAICGKRVLFAQKEERVAGALDVLDASNKNLASSKNFPQLGTAGGGYFVEAAARKLDLPESDPNAAVFRMSKQMRLQLGQQQGQLKASLSLEANSEEVAGQMRTIAEGLIALMKLQKEKPESVKVAEALTLKQDGPNVMLTIALPSDDVVEMIKVDAARKAQQKAK